MADHTEAYEGAPTAPRMSLGDWIGLLHHYLNYNSIPMNGNKTYSDSNALPNDIGGRTLMGIDVHPPLSYGVGNWHIPEYEAEHAHAYGNTLDTMSGPQFLPATRMGTDAGYKREM